MWVIAVKDIELPTHFDARCDEQGVAVPLD